MLRGSKAVLLVWCGNLERGWCQLRRHPRHSPSFSFGDGRSRSTCSTFNFTSSSAHHTLMNSELLLVVFLRLSSKINRVEPSSNKVSVD
ncbi:hypothetical protein AVEN_137846-1 [Araneus ventricosus]|uniref:Uncharacterized protein n=1 Tax=Araneus ventricosus TaxID=182803 RepID=A0A4Y2QEX3_ARAVE|nr:hypothetical protein AVEN_137846-1 [Araneus ventricosus]